MSGPQEPDPNQAWAPPTSEVPAHGQEQPPVPHEQPPVPQEPGQPQADPQAWQPPAYTPQQYPSYQPPTYAPYPPTEQFGQPPQYGQPGQYLPPGPYGQQPDYGQPPQYGQPGQYGQFPPYPQQPGPEQRPKISRTVLGAVIGGLAAVIIAVVAVLGFWKPGFFVTTKLDVNKAQAGVQQILTDETNGYGAKNVKDVSCNHGQDPVVKKGGTFDCDVSIDGAKKRVTVTFQDNKGTYEVGRPQ